ncbi:alpha/beta fold hydrolase [Nakamurella sp. YIM 132087]|uniref:Alpha/beta fold hydrolase n=1 Tax=Nakamurella alba TaxID=2665158 RepID=A0A7K1FUR7_9ACTN|nr:epoxide hydrolase family protein [Nakamurella alba]MTD17089.1 alpha/beta fold hydrolase [Nakamurella alba]
MTHTVRPYRIDVPQPEIEELRRRLRATRWADDFGNENWAYGTEKSWLQGMVEYWSEEYDWRLHEAAMNSHPNFLAEIDGVPVHFLHVPGKGPSPRPLILSHGWPWTFWDWEKVIGPLTDPAAHGGDPADAFDVVIPSLPGAGFSVPLRTTGLGARGIADLFNTLMVDVLGYDRYYAGGGDWGSTITGELGHGYPDHVIGVWMTLPNIPGVALWEITPDDFDEDEEWMWRRNAEALPTIVTHSTMNRTEPQTFAYALADSPTGLAAWLWGRRRDWGDHDGDVLTLFDRDHLCTNASLYWWNKSIASSMRIYHEHYTNNEPPPPRRPGVPTITVPTAFAVFPKELLLVPRKVAATWTNLQRWELMPRGGHYPAAEQPGLVVDELRTFFRDLPA